MLSTENYGSDSWLWIIVIFALLFGWGGNGFGGNSAIANYATQADLARGFNEQNVMSRFDTIGQNITNAAYENAQLINGVNMNTMNGFNGVTQTLNSGFDSVNSNINNLSHQLSECCCNLKTQMLQDKYDAAQNELNLAQIASANAVQTQNILGNLGRWYSNPPVNPYYVYGYNGTTIS